MAEKRVLIADNENISEIKNKGGRPVKDIIYDAEKKEVLNALLNILEITKENNVFYISDIEKDNSKINKILELELDVKKYFRCGSWSYFTKPSTCKWLSLVKAIVKDMKGEISRFYMVDKKKICSRGMKIEFDI